MRTIKLLAITCSLSAIALTACQRGGVHDGSGLDTSVHNDPVYIENDKLRSLAGRKDEDFVTDVLEANAEEMAWLRAGQNMGTDAQLKANAAHMMADHEKMDKEMRTYASDKKIDISDVDTSADVNLNEQKGREWDEEWADEVADMHEHLIKKFERAQDRVENAELKGMINKTLPTLRNHLNMANQLETRLEKPGK